MRYLTTLLLLAAIADRAADRKALLTADRALTITATAFTDSGAYLHPGVPLLRGRNSIRAFLDADSSLRGLARIPAYADVSLDGALGYTYGWTQADGKRGKYLACWKKTAEGWRLVALARSPGVADSSAVPAPPTREPATSVRGAADPRELFRADSAFAALSVASGAKPAFLEYAAEEAISFGGGTRINEGRDAIGAGFNGFPAGAVLEWWPLAADIAPSGDLGCTVGEARIASLNHYSKYLTIWKRQADGRWKFVADGGNARPGPSASGSPPPED